MWIGSSLHDLKQFPEDVKDAFGHALYLAQAGGKHPAAKPLKGFSGAGVLEIVEDFDTNTYRAVYTVRMAETVYVLHAFQKKSKSGIATPKKELELIKARLGNRTPRSKRGENKMKDITISKGNVFEDLGLAEPADRLVKAELARKIAEIITKRHLNQTEAAHLLGMDQPKISAIMNGRLAGFSLERLFQFLNIMGRDVQIVVTQKPRSRKNAGLQVICS